MRERDDEVGRERALELEPQLPVGVLLRERPGPQVHARGGESSRHRGAGGRAEDVERIGLSRHELDTEVETAPAPVRGRHQRQLVQGQRPGDAGRRDERDHVAATRAQPLDRLPDGQDVARSGKGHGPGQRGLGSRAERQQQRVIADRRTVAGVELARVGTYRFKDVGDPPDLAVACDALPFMSRRRIAPERLGDRQCAVGQVARRRQHADANALSGEGLERQQPFESTDASTRDDDVWSHVQSVAHRPPIRIGTRAQEDPWKPAGRRSAVPQNAGPMSELLILFGLGSLTALVCGLGAIPVFALGARVEHLQPLLWGLAAGLMTLASVVGLLVPALEEGEPAAVGGGLAAGVAFLPDHPPAAAGRDVHVGQTPRRRRSPQPARLHRPARAQPSGGVRDRHRLRLRPRGPWRVRDPRHRAPERARGHERRDPDARGRLHLRPAVLGRGRHQRARSRWARSIAFALVELIDGLLPASFAFAGGAMLALVVAELLPQAFTAATWRSALAGFGAGAALMLSLSAVLGV